ncbi:16381_t:CDS:2 [Funneliformis caledonium]|uniref:16381_t:CDS:1 n=1 Tax=Funneliformis caledonium TaxID=1117310 RepID=A0A9N8V451_9GLOM|nr:16381_t:CDS:2 [Funneliformis caledonium]
MFDNVASTSTSTSAPTASLLTVLKGSTFLELTREDLLSIKIPLGTAKRILKLIKLEEIKFLKYENFYLRFSNMQNSASLYRLLRNQKTIKRWKIEIEINIIKTRIISENAFGDIRELPPEQNLRKPNRFVDTGDRKQDQVYPDIIIGLDEFYSELTAKPPDLSKGLGWKIKNDIRDNSKLTEGKDGKLWQFVKIKLISDDFNNLKFNFEESIDYEWNKRTASIIADIISRYHKDLSMKTSGKKKESQNNDETYMYRNKSSISSESLLASFIKETQVRDYRIKDAVLKIHAYGYTHRDVAIQNVIQRNGHFYLIDFGLATPLQLHSDSR